jgi:hypothetical protein
MPEFDPVKCGKCFLLDENNICATRADVNILMERIVARRRAVFENIPKSCQLNVKPGDVIQGVLIKDHTELD